MTTGHTTKFAVLAAGVATIVVGLAAAGAVAASQALSPNEESKAVIDDAAEQLGVEPNALSNALKQALKNRLDATVEAGRLTTEQANELKDRIDSADGLPLFGAPGGFRHGAGHFRHFGPFGAFEAAAEYLGLTEAELREGLADMTLAELAKGKGKSVDGLVQALVADAKTRIDAAVADGRLTQEQATELKAELGSRIERFVNGDYPEGRRGFHPGFGSGGAFPRGPPGFAGPHV